MKWKELSVLQKSAAIIACLCVIASIVLTILDATEVWPDARDIGNFFTNIAYLACGVAHWKRRRDIAIMFSAVGGFFLLCDIIFLFV